VWWIAIVASAAVTAACILFVDQPVARQIAAYEPSPIWDNVTLGLEWAILFPVHGLVLPGFLVIGMLATVLVKRWRGVAPAWMMVAGVHLISRLSTSWIKDFSDRLRPHEWLKEGAPDHTFGWDRGVAFPSGHVVLFASLLIPLLAAIPREKPWLPLLGVLAFMVVIFISAARVAAGMHWISDTTGAITLVVVWTYLVGWIARPDR
jgi:undecaprenyl-diphosphatase